MAEIRVATMLELLTATDAAEDHVKKLFEWRFERTMTLVRAGFAVAGSLLLALIAALSRGDDVGTGQTVIIVAGIVVRALFSWFHLRRVQRADREYVAALELVRVFEPLTPLLRLYRP